MRVVLAAGLVVVVALLATAPHVHAVAQADHPCDVCVARTGEVARTATPDLRPALRPIEAPCLPPAVAPASGAPLGAVPGQSPPPTA